MCEYLVKIKDHTDPDVIDAARVTIEEQLDMVHLDAYRNPDQILSFLICMLPVHEYSPYTLFPLLEEKLAHVSEERVLDAMEYTLIQARREVRRKPPIQETVIEIASIWKAATILWSYGAFTFPVQYIRELGTLVGKLLIEEKIVVEYALE